MIVKMKFLNISGPRVDIDRVCEKYLSRHEMQLENALTELKTVHNLQPFAEVNPYKEPLAKVEEFVSLLQQSAVPSGEPMTEEEMLERIRAVNHDYVDLVEKKELQKKRRDALIAKLAALEPFAPLDIDIQKFRNYRYMKVRFGRISVDYFRRLEKYLYDDLYAIFLEGARNENYVYGCYIESNADAGKSDSAFSSFHFERIDIPVECMGTPAFVCEGLKADIEAANQELDSLEAQINDLMAQNAPALLTIRKRLEESSNRFDVRKMAARMESGEDKEDYYILCGWMGEDDVEALLKETENDSRVMIVVEEDRQKYFGDPPTKLKNPKFFQPFEMFVRMYGLPSANEMDPTVFVALSYTFIFGVMFGDLGQGLCLFVFGGILYLVKKINLAGIISVAGIFSAFFGLMFGSVFGFEDVIKPLWLRPTEAMVDLPFIGQLNTVFVVAVAFGMGLNLLMMVFQVLNAWKIHDTENLWFSHNGVAGIIFYGFLVLTIVLYMTGHKTPGNLLMVLFLGGPVVVFVLKEPLANLVEKNHKKIEEGKVMFFVQGFFELFETMLSYFSNTISYVRIGAFAVSHAAMMEVVLMLSGVEDGRMNLLVIVLGNIIVCGMEGLIVGIQVLRLEYYEMFSRFYKGSGREFHPFNSNAGSTK